MRLEANGYFAGLVGVALGVAALAPLRDRINSTPVALAFLLVVLFTAARFGSSPAVAASIVSVLCMNYFFVHPYHTLVVADPQNWIALGAFLMTALIAGSLSARAKRRAEEAEKKQREIERLYVQLKEMFAKAGEAEVMKQSERLKSALLDAVTHDLRTPLTSMKAAVTTMLAGGVELDGEGKREMLEVIHAEIDRLNHHLEGLIEIAKIEAGAMEPRRAWSDLEEIVSISLMRSSALTSHHSIKTELEPDIPPVRVDEKAISEVIYLLLENAAKYSPPRSEILIQAATDRKGALKVSVQDTGIGIPPALREKVFDKFYRSSADSDSQSRPAGLGMGLAIARSLVESHGGRIWIEETGDARGTRISFTIPLSGARPS